MAPWRLAASKEKEIQEEIASQEIAAKLEREKKDKEAAEQRNKVLSEANRRAKQRIYVGNIVLFITFYDGIISNNSSFYRKGSC